MPTTKDDATQVNLRAHVPTAVLLALFTALNGGAYSCTSRQDEIVRKLDEVRDDVRALRGETQRIDRRVSRLEGARGAGPTED